MLKPIILAFLVAATILPTAYAQPVPRVDTGRVDFPITTVRNVSTLGTHTVTPSSVNRFAFAVANNGLVVADAATGLPLPNGQKMPGTVIAHIPKASIAPALARFATKSLPFLSTGYALYDLSRELGFGMINQDGTLVVTKQEQTLRDGFVYQMAPFQGPTPNAVCALWVTANTPAGASTSPQTMFSGGTHFCRMVLAVPGNPPNFGTYVPIDVVPSQIIEFETVDSTLQEFQDAIAQKSGWPTSSNLARATKAAIEAGEFLPAVPQTVTGPASVPGPEVVTQKDGVTTTNTTTYNNTYNGPNVTTTVVTNNTETNTTTGDVITNTTTTTTPAPAEPPDPPCGVPGKPPCDVKIDETGTPEDGADRLNDDKTGLGEIRPAFDAAITDIEQIAAPDWTWTFQLPTGCSPLPMGAFGFEVNICQFQPTIHDLMSLVWIAAGIFGLLGLLRSALGGNT